MSDLLVSTLRTLNEFLTAGVAITAFSMLLYALSFNLRDRVARSFAMIMLCVVIVFVGDALGSVSQTPEQLDFWLRFQWIGIIFLPPAYLHFSDALLATTGRPSRGRRRIAVRLGYLVAAGFIVALATSRLVGPLVMDGEPAPHLQRLPLTWFFTSLYILAMLLTWGNMWRAFQRTVTSTSRRRMSYLIAGALAPALGSYPYLLFDSGIASHFPLGFWFAVTASNLFTSVLLVLMAYAVAFFGVPWPDRVVKRRLAKWLMRGPVTASTTLFVTTIVRRASVRIGLDSSAIVPTVMAACILIFEHLISLAAPIWERWLFPSKDRADMELLQTLEERLLTMGDLRQFLEAILAAVCDRLQTSSAFIAILEMQSVKSFITIGGDRSLEEKNVSDNLLQAAAQHDLNGGLFTWGNYWLVPLYDPEEPGELLGLMGVLQQAEQTPDDEQMEALSILAERATLALGDRRREQQAFSFLESLTPKMAMIQSLRAAARYDGVQVLSQPETLETTIEENSFAQWVKDALTHYWGGPKLTESPLLSLQIVQQAAQEQEENPTNALRTILRKAIEEVRPQGERRFTAEWILYNILEMKFMEGRKVREIAMRLAVSEADLYRKQRVAIEAVARAIAEMEKQVRQEQQELFPEEPAFFPDEKIVEENAQGGLNGKYTL